MKLQFSEITFLIGTGQLNIDQFLSVYKKGQPLIAADGGANHLYALHIIPDNIIGDLDSLEHKDEWKQKTNVIYIEEQDSTDLEKVLHNTDAPLYLAFGFAGDRFDHTLEIVHILAKYQEKNIIFFAGDDIAFRIPKKWNVQLPIGTRISLYPLHETKIVSSSGLYWPVDNLLMKQGTRIGTSNKTIDEHIAIEQDKEDLIAIVHASLYKNIISSL
jgi:thiamine pyrophosphokinase